MMQVALLNSVFALFAIVQFCHCALPTCNGGANVITLPDLQLLRVNPDGSETAVSKFPTAFDEMKIRIEIHTGAAAAGPTSYDVRLSIVGKGTVMLMGIFPMTSEKNLCNSAGVVCKYSGFPCKSLVHKFTPDGSAESQVCTVFGDGSSTLKQSEYGPTYPKLKAMDVRSSFASMLSNVNLRVMVELLPAGSTEVKACFYKDFPIQT